MSLINISNLTFSYDGSYDDIFTDVSFQIDTDWKLGFCGRNGRGKTTFLKLLMGHYEYRGEISANVSFEYFPFDADDMSLTTLDILTKITPDAQAWQVSRELSKLAVNEDVLDRPFETLSNGERTKILLAGLFLRENSFLLIDEPTNHLDMTARDTVARYLNGKSGFILVSHDRAFLDACVDHTLSINKANIEVMNGNFSTWWQQKRLRDASETAENEKLKKDIKRLEHAARQSSGWADKVESSKKGRGAAATRKGGHDNIDTMAYNAEKSRRMQQRRKNLERRQNSAIEEKSKLLKNLEEADELKIHPLRYHAPRLLSLENVSVNYENCKGETTSYTYDSLGNLIKEQAGSKTTEYWHNELNQIYKKVAPEDEDGNSQGGGVQGGNRQGDEDEDEDEDGDGNGNDGNKTWFVNISKDYEELIAEYKPMWYNGGNLNTRGGCCGICRGNKSGVVR